MYWQDGIFKYCLFSCSTKYYDNEIFEYEWDAVLNDKYAKWQEDYINWIQIRCLHDMSKRESCQHIWYVKDL